MPRCQDAVIWYIFSLYSLPGHLETSCLSVSYSYHLYIAITSHLSWSHPQPLPSTLGRTGLCGWEHSITLGCHKQFLEFLTPWFHQHIFCLHFSGSISHLLCYSLSNVLWIFRVSENKDNEGTVWMSHGEARAWKYWIQPQYFPR